MSIRQGNKIIAGNVDNTDYTTLLNKPQINSIELNGNKTLEELGIQASGDYATTSELELKADKADTLAGYGITDGLNTSQITNCITKIPQDIKLEINDGALTIKAGSKVYIPNGIGIFDEYTFSSDLIRTKDSSLYDIPVVILLYRQDINFIDFFPTSRVYSGNTAPDTSMYDIWFDTLNNKIKTNLDTVWTETNTSLPFAIGTVSSSSGFTIINQIFNGFGYIGSTVFALPNVEGLIPNGRNDDGSLNNIKFIVDEVKTINLTASNNYILAIDANKNLIFSSLYKYDDKKNEVYRSDNGKIVKVCFCGTCDSDSTGRITSFSPKNVFQAIDRNDTNWASTASKPSNRYIDLNLEASGTKYIMPANGRLFLNKQGNTNEYCHIFRTNKNPQNGLALGASPTGAYTAGYVVQKGDEIQIDYNLSGTTFAFNFIYDEGAK